MKNITAIILALLLAANAAAAQTKRALCIGIGSYMDKTWPEIHGDKDIEDLIVPMLSKNGFSSENIKVLLNERATSKNIKDAFNALLKSAQPGDKVFVYLSGHGQQVTDLDGDEAIINNNSDTLDEAFVPYDAPMRNTDNTSHKDMKHITDDYFYDILLEIFFKVGERGSLSVMNDACHSGDMTRGSENRRGSSVIYVLPASKNIIKFSADRTKRVPFAVISSCTDSETTREELHAGKYYGPLAIGIREYKGENIETLLNNIAINTRITPVREGSGKDRPLF